MNNVFFAALSATLMIFFFVAAGYILQKGKFVPENASAVIASVQMKLFVPVMQLYIIITYVTPKDIKENWQLVLAASLLIVLTTLLSKPVARLLSKNKLTAKALVFGLVFSNFGFMAIPVIESVFDANGFMILTLFDIPYYITVNALGEYIIKKDAKINRSMLITPVNVTIVLGLAIAIFQIPIGGFLQNLIHTIYCCVTPLAMLLVGLVLAKRRLGDMLKNPAVYVLCLLRLAVIPAIVYFALYLCGFRGSALAVPVIVMGMPTAANGVMLAESGGGDSFTVAQSVFISTVLSIITIPVLAYFVV